ncbi:class I SAM-dependent RNA methyltransferase [Brevibacterium casei]|nr:class I SAM-dependent RNA methyltransferase [Brevibacterium casei]
MSPHTPASAHPNGEDLVLRIEGPAAGGSFVARDDGRVVFVSGALPGELVRARTVPGPGKVLRAEVTEVLEASEHRVPDRRIDYLAEAAGPDDRGAGGLFGGMEFAHVDLAHSRDLKAEIVTDRRGASGDSTGEVTVSAAPGETTGTDWRTRVQLAVDRHGELGMVRSRDHDVVAVGRAPLAVTSIAEVDLGTVRLPGAERVEFAATGQTGAVIVRGAVEDTAARLRRGPARGLVAAHRTGAPPRQTARRGHDRRARGRHRGSAHRSHGGSAAGEPTGPLQVHRGTETLTETVAGRDFTVSADGFWQVHEQAAAPLSDRVVAALPDDAREIVDLYCGVGPLGIGAAAATGACLYGVEGVGPAIEHARTNAAGLDAEFVAGRVDTATLPDSDVVILDPPRAGAGKAVTDRLVESGPDSIVYVSCDAGTLARDLAALTAGGYAIESLEGFDLFPLTAHIETVTVLRR